jgi:uncharacterized protein
VAPTLLAGLVAIMMATSFVSGIFGMAGGMILLGILLAVLSVPDAMALHAVTQVTSNGWRGLLWIRYVRWISAFWFLFGCGIAFVICSMWRYVPPASLTFVLLGATPFLIRLIPREIKPDPDRPMDGILVGAASMVLMLLSGVSGPLIDAFFLGRKFERRQVVATKAACQFCCHAAKLVYFGRIVDQAGALDHSMVALAVVATVAGSSLAKPVLEGLTDAQYRLWANRIITAIACLYMARGLYLSAMSALPLKVDIPKHTADVRFCAGNRSERGTLLPACKQISSGPSAVVAHSAVGDDGKCPVFNRFLLGRARAPMTFGVSGDVECNGDNESWLQRRR